MAQPPDGNTANTGPSNLLAQAHGLATLVAMLHGKMLIEAAYKIKTNNATQRRPQYMDQARAANLAHICGVITLAFTPTYMLSIMISGIEAQYSTYPEKYMELIKQQYQCTKNELQIEGSSSA